MLLIVDPITVFVTDFAQLPEALGRPEFCKAVRFLRPSLHSPDYLWSAWRSGTLGRIERESVDRALAEYFEADPEYARLALLGLTYYGPNGHDAEGRSPRTHIVPVPDDATELEALGTFWRVAKWAVDRHCTFVTYGGRAWGLPFVVRRTILRGQAPTTFLPIGRARLDTHFDVEDVLANWDRTRRRALELAARQYGLEGPWLDTDSPDVPTATAIRTAVRDGVLERATRLSLLRMRAIHGLYERLREPYLAAT